MNDAGNPPEALDLVQRWAAAELRSFNGQVEFILRRALGEAGRLPSSAEAEADGAKEP